MKASDRHPRADVVGAVLDILQTNPPMTRSEIVGALMRRGWTEKVVTLARHVRRAIGWLQVAGFSVGTWGQEFRTLGSPSERLKAARVLVSQAAWLLLRAMRLTSGLVAEKMLSEELGRMEHDYPREKARQRVEN